MKRIVSIIVSCVLVVSTVVFNISVEAVTNPFNCNFVTGAIQETIVPISDNDTSGLPAISGTLPSTVDLSESDYFPCVRSQDSMLSCTAWATTYYQFGYQVAAMNSWNAKEDATKQFSPKWTYNLENNGNNRGISFSEAYYVLSNHGAVRYSEFTPGTHTNYKEYTEWYLNKEDMKKALQYRVSDYKYLSFSNSSAKTPIISPNSVSLSVMKSLLNSGNILTFSTDMGEWDYEVLANQYDSALDGEYVCIKQFDANKRWDGHAMAIVGYDDNISYDLNGDGIIQKYEKGALKIVNSWGENYGNDGFMWVMYDALNTVSNTNVQNVENRKALMDDYAYYVITVDSYPLDLFVEISINNVNRNQVLVQLGNSNESISYPEKSINNFLKFEGGEFNLSGLEGNPPIATLVFDYGELCETNSVRKNYYVSIQDCKNGQETMINSIHLIDNTGKIVVSDEINNSIDASSYVKKYKIGMVGDINNDARIDNLDVSLLQSYINNVYNLSDEETSVSDTNGDGNIDIKDVSELSKYIAGRYENLHNGHFAFIN